MAIDLIILVAIPIVLALPLYLLGRSKPSITKWGTVLVTLATTIYSVYLWVTNFVPAPSRNSGTDGFMLHYTAEWISSVGITFSFGVDGLSMPLVVLTQFIFLVSAISSFYIKEQEALFYSMVLVLLTGVTGTFVALDMFLFYIFWELVLVPMYFLINAWGGDNRRYAAIKFFIYTHLASLVMLIGLFLIYINAPNADGSYTFYLPALRDNLAASPPEIGVMVTIFWLVFVGFVTKFPQVPVHTWLPDAHVQAPSPGSAILAGLLLKMGGYGLFRIPFWLFSDVRYDGVGFFHTDQGKNIRVAIAIIGMISMAYPAFVALRQIDMKRMIAYSSISHMGIVLLGMAAYNKWGFNGAMYMMIAHGIISPGLFLLSGIVEHNTKSHTRDMDKVGGLAHNMPFTGGLFVFMAFASAGLPGLAGFVAEFNAFVGLFSDDLLGSNTWVWIPVIAVISIIITAGYYLWAIQRVIFNEPTDEIADSKPAHWWETGPVFLLALMSLIFGLAPALVWWVLDNWTAGVLA